MLILAGFSHHIIMKGLLSYTGTDDYCVLSLNISYAAYWIKNLLFMFGIFQPVGNFFCITQLEIKEQEL